MPIAMTLFPGEIGANKDATLDRWHEIFQYVMRPGILRSVAGDPFSSYTDELRIDGNASMLITANPGRIWALGKIWKLTSVGTEAVASNSSGSTRYDLVVARCDLTSGSTAQIQVVQGGASPPSPTRNTSTYDVRLAVITVTNGMTVTNGGGTITDLREFARPFGADRYGVVDSTGALQKGEGMSPISTAKQATGVYRFAFDFALPDTDFTATAEAEHASTPLVTNVTARNVNYVEITVKNLSGTATDPTRLHCRVSHPRQNILGGT